jgi:hypothetical protein
MSEYISVVNLTFPIIITTKCSVCVGDWLDPITEVKKNVKPFWPRAEIIADKGMVRSDMSKPALIFFFHCKSTHNKVYYQNSSY